MIFYGLENNTVVKALVIDGKTEAQAKKWLSKHFDLEWVASEEKVAGIGSVYDPETSSWVEEKLETE